MSFSLNKRLLTALAISLALHSVMLMLTGSVRQRTIGEGQDKFRVTLAVPSHLPPSAEAVTSSTQQDAPTLDTSSLSNSASVTVSALPADDHYFLFQEVDKRSDFIYSEPLAQLEKVIGSDTEVKLTVKILINEEGLVDSVTVLEAVPSDIYNEESVKALLQSRFSPAEKGGRKVKSQKILEIKFAAKGAI